MVERGLGRGCVYCSLSGSIGCGYDKGMIFTGTKLRYGRVRGHGPYSRHEGLIPFHKRYLASCTPPAPGLVSYNASPVHIPKFNDSLPLLQFSENAVWRTKYLARSVHPLALVTMGRDVPPIFEVKLILHSSRRPCLAFILGLA